MSGVFLVIGFFYLKNWNGSAVRLLMVLIIIPIPKIISAPIIPAFNMFLAVATPCGPPPDIKYIIPDTIIVIATKTPAKAIRKPPVV